MNTSGKLRRFVVVTMIFVTQSIQAQKAADAPVQNGDIVVTARPDKDEPDFSNSRPMVIVGSRIPRESLQHNPYIASATSLGGLTPDSGLDAFGSIRNYRWQTCKADGAAVRKHVACRLARVQQALTTGHPLLAEELILPLSTDSDLTLEERYVVQEYRYRIAEAIPDAGRRRTALAAMVATGFMPVAKERAAQLTLASMALKAGDPLEAIERYRAVAKLEPDDTQSRINAAALLQRIGRSDESKSQIREAIAIARRTD
ncbi:tetratricopeptide repeat protein [Sphingosinicellaceae bacterium]|nr:tetratricopeptide repeat protein [Sphingosinicellaceae bacterium]